MSIHYPLSSSSIMLSAQTVSRLADALKEEVIEEIYQSERYNEVMQELIGEAMEKKLGKCDEDLFFEIGMCLMDRIELK
tara:strand:+ start:181 stop:417 length:237 start_codon:yes stop_codon:yes gene_type:complete